MVETYDSDVASTIMTPDASSDQDWSKVDRGSPTWLDCEDGNCVAADDLDATMDYEHGRRTEPVLPSVIPAVCTLFKIWAVALNMVLMSRHRLILWQNGATCSSKKC